MAQAAGPFKCPVCVYTVSRSQGTTMLAGWNDCKCYQCGEIAKPPRAYLEAARKYFAEELHRCKVKLLPLSTTLETLLANEARAHSSPLGHAVSDATTTFAWQCSAYLEKKKIAERREAFVKLFDVDG